MINALPIVAIAFTLALLPSPQDELDIALRQVTTWSHLEEGIDYEVDMSGPTPAVYLSDSTCFTASNLRCHDQAMHCKYVAAGTVCVYCDGTGSGGAWTATNGICVQNPGDSCLVNPAGQGACGKQRRSTCAGPAGALPCTAVAVQSRKDCEPKECT